MTICSYAALNFANYDRDSWDYSTEVLAKLHTLDIIHKNINPANIVFNSHTGGLKLIDFGIATVLTSENTTIKNSNNLEANLTYLSPEQTGRRSRFLDYRTDFYSLGVTFYQLLTNSLPFTTKDAMELGILSFGANTNTTTQTSTGSSLIFCCQIIAGNIITSLHCLYIWKPQK